MQEPSIKTIAAALGVSAAAVSKALNDKPDVSQDLKRRVEAEIRRQGFLLNRAARALVTGRGRSIGLYLLNRFGRPVREYFGFQLIDGLLEAAQQADFDLVILQDTKRQGIPMDLVAHAAGRGVAAVIVFGLSPSDGRADLLRNAPFPVVAVDTPGADLPFVSSDQAGGLALAVRHITGLGHRNLAYLGLRGGGWVASERLRGYRLGLSAYLSMAALGPPREVEAVLDLEGGQMAGHDILHRWPDTSAIVCATDLQAMGACRAIRATGRRIPEDVSVTGFDDLQASQLMEPPLTTIAQDPHALGASAGRLALDLVAGQTGDSPGLLPVKLIIRQSSGPMPLTGVLK